MRIPFIKKYLRDIPAWHIGAISRLEQQQDHEKAVEVAIRALERFGQERKSISEFDKDDSWWFIMRLAVRSLQRCEKNAAEKWKRLIQLAEDREPRLEGYDVAYSFLAFSRWKIQEKAYGDAVAFAKIASEADATWGEPDFYLGLCSFAVDAGDPIEHLGNAIKKDHRMLFRISNDKNCKRRPHIIAKLKELAVEDGVVVGPDEVDETDDAMSR